MAKEPWLRFLFDHGIGFLNLPSQPSSQSRLCSQPRPAALTLDRRGDTTDLPSIWSLPDLFLEGCEILRGPDGRFDTSEAICETRTILNRRTRTLSQKWCHGVRCIADQKHHIRLAYSRR